MPRQTRTVECAECGTAFETTSHNAKFCPGKPACRKAASRRPNGLGAHEAAKGEKDQAGKFAEAEVQFSRRHVLDRVWAELQELGAHKSVEGELALELAACMGSAMETASAKSTASKELRSLMAEIRRRAGEKSDGLAGIEAGAESKLRLVK